MSYKDKHGITDIYTPDNHKVEKLDISFSRDWDNGEKYPVLYYGPDVFNHYHIDLTKAEATVLRDWLNAYLSDVTPVGEQDCD